LAKTKTAQTNWAKLSYTHQKEIAEMDKLRSQFSDYRLNVYLLKEPNACNPCGASSQAGIGVPERYATQGEDREA